MPLDPLEGQNNSRLEKLFLVRHCPAPPPPLRHKNLATGPSYNRVLGSFNAVSDTPVMCV